MDSVTDCVWLSFHKPDIISRGYWDDEVLEEVFIHGQYRHHDGMTNYWNNATNDGAIVIINGRTHADRKDIAKLNQELNPLRWILLIVTGDEESLFDHTQVKHSLMKQWIQLPRKDKHNDAYKLINGYRPDTSSTLKTLARIHGMERDLDYCFIGQVTHRRRDEMIEAINELPIMEPNGFVHKTSTFGGVGEDGISQIDYLDYFKRSKIVLCPSGPESPDSFRVWEALEAGCLPIVDSHATNTPEPGFWEYLLGNDIPFPIVNEWSELPMLLPQLLADYPHNVNRAFSWWQLKKREIRKQLEHDASVWK